MAHLAYCRCAISFFERTAMNSIKKKAFWAFVIALALCALCAIGLCSCGGSALKTTSDSSSTSASSQTQTAQSDETTNKDAATSEKGESKSAQATNASGSQESASSSGTPSGSSAAPAPEPEPEPEPEPAPTFGVSISVDASAAGQGYFISTYVTLWEGATVYDALCATGLAFGGDSNYVRSINGLSEFDHGKGSGWMYSVNGTTPMTPCGSYVLSNGDSVYWYYVV